MKKVFAIFAIVALSTGVLFATDNTGKKKRKKKCAKKECCKKDEAKTASCCTKKTASM
jgi:hypothetical protein